MTPPAEELVPHPLRELWSRYRRYRPRLVGAVSMSVLNKVMDVMPELIIGAAIDVAVAVIVAGPPTFDPRPGYVAGLLYLAFAASALAFSLYIPVVRAIGPARAAYSSVLVPIIAMGFSTWLEDYRWTAQAIAGALLALGGMVVALSRSRITVQSPDAA